MNNNNDGACITISFGMQRHIFNSFKIVVVLVSRQIVIERKDYIFQYIYIFHVNIVCHSDIIVWTRHQSWS